MISVHKLALLLSDCNMSVSEFGKIKILTLFSRDLIVGCVCVCEVIHTKHLRQCLPHSKLRTAKWLQSCPTLCDLIDGSPPGSAMPGILQARTLEWVAISFSSAWKWKVKVKFLSHVQLFATPWTVAYQAPPSMGFSRQEYWSGPPLPSPSILLLSNTL